MGAQKRTVGAIEIITFFEVFSNLGAHNWAQ